MEKKNIALSICIIIAAITIIGSIYLVNELGTYFNNLIYTRFIFGIGIISGFMILWVGHILGYSLINLLNKNKKLILCPYCNRNIPKTIYISHLYNFHGIDIKSKNE